mgnify:CR=1 FL=1
MCIRDSTLPMPLQFVLFDDFVWSAEQSEKYELKSKSITLSCGKLTTGVTIKPWTGIFMLRNTTSPETYFQSAFRVQSPWTIPLEKKNEVMEELILKKECCKLSE